MSLRSPLGRVLGSGSAKNGTTHWWAQRVSAVALIILGAWFLLSLQLLPGFEHQQLLTWVGRPFNSVALVLLVATLAYHSSLGLQVVIEDYVHGHFTKIISLILNKFFHIFVAVAAIFAVLKVSFGAVA